ncbi:hypothetical protein [Noviherbaspirillum malthae]|uniref:hypothetical protein n=1 Tax=Noviherbaspirillum malthae TaxID=1260987 RepID=UPI00188EA6E9|nr:hypothetical protein [Noviherbaspirillum malthae]
MIAMAGNIKKFTQIVGLPYQSFVDLRRKCKPLSEKYRVSIEHALGLPDQWLNVVRDGDMQTLLMGIPTLCDLKGEDNSPAMQELRRTNLRLLVGIARGAVRALCERMGWVAPIYSKLLSVSFGARKARQIEQCIGLPEGWFDIPHPDYGDLPAEFDRRCARLCGIAVHKSDPVMELSVGEGEKSSRPLMLQLPAVVLTVRCAPISRALIETLVRRANSGDLSEEEALELLNSATSIRRPGLLR